MIKEIRANTNQRVFAVGDIHGMYHILEELLKKANFDKNNDILIGVGDLIDRGTSSHLALKYLSEPWFISTVGNHEHLLINHLIEKNDYWKRNGGEWDPKHYSYEDFKKEFEKLPLAIELSFFDKKIGFVHAGVPMFISDWTSFKEKLFQKEVFEASLWDRSRFKLAKNNFNDYIENIDLVVSGHTITENILLSKNSLFIDTGGFFLHEEFYNPDNKYRLSLIEFVIEDNTLLFINHTD